LPQALLQDLDFLATLALSLAERWSAESPQLDEGQRALARHSLDRASKLIGGMCSHKEE
jgi:hypothetical protein